MYWESYFYLSVASFFAFLDIFKRENNLYFTFCAPVRATTQLFHHLHFAFKKLTEKNKICSMFVVSVLVFFGSPWTLFIGKHSFIIYHGGWDENNFMLGPSSGGRYWRIWSDKSVISISAVVIFLDIFHRKTHRHSQRRSRDSSSVIRVSSRGTRRTSRRNPSESN